MAVLSIISYLLSIYLIYLQRLHVLVELAIEGVVGHGERVAEDDEFHASAGDGDVHAAQVAQEANLPFVVGAHERDEDDVAFLTLESIDSVHGEQVPEGFEEGVALEKVAQMLHLCAVGRDDAHVDLLFQKAGLADFRQDTDGLLKIFF